MMTFKGDNSKITNVIFQELKDTQEQLRDILFHLEAQNKLSSENTGLDAKELEDGQISVGASSTPQSRRRSRRKK